MVVVQLLLVATIVCHRRSRVVTSRQMPRKKGAKTGKKKQMSACGKQERKRQIKDGTTKNFVDAIGYTQQRRFSRESAQLVSPRFYMWPKTGPPSSRCPLLPPGLKHKGPAIHIKVSWKGNGRREKNERFVCGSRPADGSWPTQTCGWVMETFLFN